MSYIEVALQGRVGSLPIERSTQAGKRFVTLTVIVQEKGAEAGEWVNVSVFEPVLDALPADIAKQERVYIEGRVKVNRWADQNGQTRFNLQVTANRILVLDRVGRRRARKIAPQAADYANPQPIGNAA